LAQVGPKPSSMHSLPYALHAVRSLKRAARVSQNSIMKTSLVVLGCLVTLTAAAPEYGPSPAPDPLLSKFSEAAVESDLGIVNQAPASAPSDGALPFLEQDAAPAPAPPKAVPVNKVETTPVVKVETAPVDKVETTPAPTKKFDVDATNKIDAIKPNATYSNEPTTPDKATSLSGSETDIDASVRERIEQDSKRIGKIAENLVGVQGDINTVEKEVLGKVFDMSTMKSFLNAHESAIKDNEKLDKEQDDLNKQATALSKQLDKSINETTAQDKKHRASMAQLSAKVSEDKAVIQGLQGELVPLVEMQKETEKLPPINSNLTAQNTKAVAAAQAATEELIYEKSKLKTYRETTTNLMKELVKQHDYAGKCRERLYQLNTQLHEISSKEAKMKYEQGLTSSRGEAMEKALEEKNKIIQTRLKKAKTNLQTINFAKSNMKSKISALQTEGQIQLEKLKDELGKLRQQSAGIEAAMMAKISNRKLIEKALRGASVQMTDMQTRLLAGRLDKLRRNNTQMSGDLAQIRAGLETAQVNTAKAEAQRTQLLAQAAQVKQQAANKTAEVQDVAREALAQVVAARQSDDDAQQKAQEATM